jgi:hypothetical protein
VPYVMCPSCQKVGHTAASLHAGPSLCPRCGALLPARRTVVPLSRYLRLVDRDGAGPREPAESLTPA